MSVAAVDSSGNKASFSQYNIQVEIAAPGVGVMSTLPNNTYAAWSGTSMATPHVSGVAALVWSNYPSCTNAQVRKAMAKSAKDGGTEGRDNHYGYGIVKAKAMYDLFAIGCDVGELPPPPEPTILVNAVPEEGLSGVPGDELMYQMEFPADESNLAFDMSGGSGDADLYVKFGSIPSITNYDCRSYTYTNTENCSFAEPQTGTYFVMVRGYTGFSGVTLVGSFDANTPPVSSFNYSCSNLRCSFDASGSYDIDGNIVLYDWSFGDGTLANGESPQHTYAAAGDYTVTLTVKDDDGATGISEEVVSVTAGSAGGDITLAAYGYKIRGTKYVDLEWVNASGVNVEIHRTKNRDTRVITTENDGAHTDSFSSGGTFVYKVCEVGGSVCSAEQTVVF